jgi:hypothetical protein
MYICICLFIYLCSLKMVPLGQKYVGFLMLWLYKLYIVNETFFVTIILYVTFDREFLILKTAAIERIPEHTNQATKAVSLH